MQNLIKTKKKSFAIFEEIGGYGSYPAIFARWTKWKSAITEIDPSRSTILMVIFSRLALKGIELASRYTGQNSPIFRTLAICRRQFVSSAKIRKYWKIAHFDGDIFLNTWNRDFAPLGFTRPWQDKQDIFK